MDKKIVSPSVEKLSLKYIDSLDTITKARYLDKLKIINDKDPYEIDKGEWSTDITKWPEVCYPDIVNYLVYTQSAYTLAELKAYKSLQSYNYFISGFVHDIRHLDINGKTLFLAKVKHSQRMNDASLMPWIITDSDGSVVSAHCTCMAGVGEVCSHVGALLFAIDAAVKIRNTKTVTEEKAYWLLPSAVSKVNYKTVQDIDFTSARTKKKQMDRAIANSELAVHGLKQRKLPDVQEPSKDELSSLFTALNAAGKRPVLLSLVPGYAEMYKPKVLHTKYPKVLSDLYDETFASVSPSQLKQHAENVFQDLKVSDEEAANCEMDTRDQSNCKQWYSFRSGRLTASRMKAICRTPIDNPSKSLIKDICYPASKKFSSKATEWGCEHESSARQQYFNDMSQSHTNFKIKVSGFVIDPRYPYIGASPDGIASCDCCGEVLVEIKCPFCKRDFVIDSSIDCLATENNNLHLKRTHQYYYQVQCQLLVTGKEFCDFVVWTNKDMFVERIAVDDSFCQEIIAKSETFFKSVILPQLIGKLYSRPLREQQLNISTSATISPDSTVANNDKEIICTCRSEYDENTDNVIGCDNQNCPYKWLHFSCAGIKRVPKGKWLCKHCRQQKKKT